MKKFISFGLVAIVILAVTLTFGKTAFAQAWEVFVSNHRFVINGESAEVSALNINGRNYISIADFAELFNIDIRFEEATETVYMYSFDVSKNKSECEEATVVPDRHYSSRPASSESTAASAPINWDIDLSQIYDGEIYDGVEIDHDWMDQFRINGTFTAHEGSYSNGIIYRGIILSGSRVVILNNNQYIILDDRETINRVTASMNFSFDETAILLMENRLQWEFMEAYFPFLSNETIEKLVGIYNSHHPANQHRSARDYFIK